MPDCLHKSVNENHDMPKISPNCLQAQWVVICCTSQYQKNRLQATMMIVNAILYKEQVNQLNETKSS